MRLGKSLIPVVLLAIQLVHFIAAITAMPVFSLARLPQVFADAYGAVREHGLDHAGVVAVDYVVEWRQWENRLKMSKQEMREEFKETEGNPQMKGRIRSTAAANAPTHAARRCEKGKRGNHQPDALCGSASPLT